MINDRMREQIVHLVNEEHHPIRYVSKMLNVDRNTVRRCLKQEDKADQNSNRMSENRLFLELNKSSIEEFYITCEFRCPPLQRLIEERFSRLIPLRMLERFCSGIRKEYQIQQRQNDVPKRFETIPGQQMQIDFGEKVVFVNGEKVKLHFFVCKLSYSRRIFAKAYWVETQAAWLDGIESAFRYFNGTPYEIVCDNASSLVRDHYATDETLKFTERFY